IETEGYQLRLLPGAETAGIVFHNKNDPSAIRNIATYYFFKLEIPAADTGREYEFSNCQKNGVRNVSLTDPFNRWVYILHYPAPNATDTAIVLKLE
ncbi:hypothetical protein KKI24_07610, partial [bacterium]|nr:hypothetical protein [bacterium]